MNSYEKKIEDRKAMFAERAEKARREAEGRSKSAHSIMDNIPLGQPILVGHHSEKRHRRDVAKIQRNLEKWREATEKAAYYERKAATYGTAGISADDPDAIAKLKAELEVAQLEREMEKKANADLRKASKQAIKKATAADAERPSIFEMIDALTDITPEIKERLARRARAFPQWLPQLSSNGQVRIKRLADRIEALERAAAAPPRETVIGEGYCIQENRDLNRVQIRFDVRVSDEWCAKLKSRGFKWARSEQAWQRQLNPTAWHVAVELLKGGL